MRFAIRRTSSWATDQLGPEDIIIRNKKLAKKLNLKKIKYPFFDIRCCKDPKLIPINNGTDGDWYTHGKDHCVVNGKIQRTLEDREVWTVEINTLEELNELIKSQGYVIIGEQCYGTYDQRDNTYLTEIEIYDGYRE